MYHSTLIKSNPGLNHVNLINQCRTSYHLATLLSLYYKIYRHLKMRPSFDVCISLLLIAPERQKLYLLASHTGRRIFRH